MRFTLGYDTTHQCNLNIIREFMKYLFPYQISTVCGYSLEINATSDMDFYCSNQQAELMLDIMQSNVLSLITPATQG